MSTYNLGRILPNFRGTWESSYNYFIMDIVYYNGSSYVAKSDIHAGGTNPSINNNWQIIAMKGELSGTLTPEQEQAIINAIMSQGVVVDATYNHTDNNYTDADKAKVDNIGDGVLTIKRNNTTIGTFTANSGTDTSINISVPTTVSELTGYENLQHRRSYETLTAPNPIISLLKQNLVYYSTSPLTSLDIRDYEVDPTDKSTWIGGETYIFFETGVGFTLTTPINTLFATSNTFEDNQKYMIRVIGVVFEIYKLS